jgi:hypothetical protein
MGCEDKIGVMRGMKRALEIISQRTAVIGDMEVFEDLSCAMMEFVCLALFQMWQNKELDQAGTFSDLLNLFNDRVLKLADSDRNVILALREEINEELKAT